MKESIGHMNFFAMKKCGLYRVGDEKVYGCDSSETFYLIAKWLEGRPFSTTIPWDPLSNNSNKVNCYCKDFYYDGQTGDYLFVLWKSSDTDGKSEIWGVAEDDRTGDGEVVEYKGEYKGRKLIWGRPAYYWVIPSLNTVVSIKFEHSVCDSQMFEDWVIGCVNNRVDHPGKIKDCTDAGYVRISFAEGDKIGRYAYRFQTGLRSLNTTSAELNELAKKITHIIKRETIRVKAADERAQWVRFISDKIPFINGSPKSKSRQIEVKFEAKPTPQEIKDIIESYATESKETNQWDNVGFLTENGVTWVNKYRLRDYIHSPSSSAGRLNKADKLYSLIRAQRAKLIAPILKHIESESVVVVAGSSEVVGAA